MKKVVYFNQWFSSITDVIADLKEKYGDTVEFIASSKNPNHVYKTVVDKFIVEDWEEVHGDKEKSMENYFNFVINLCKQHKVDIFFAKKHSDYLCKKRFELALHGVFTVIENEETFSRFLYKSQVYRDLEQVKELKDYIPEYFVIGDTMKESNVEDVEHFFNCYKKEALNKKWCLKKDSDEGGASFRAIKNRPFTFNSLLGFRVNECTTDEVLNLIKEEPENAKKLIFMEILESPEISVDCYNSKKGFVAICRSKGKDRVQKIFFNKELYEVCKKIGQVYNMQFAFNVQFRYEQSDTDNPSGKLKLLEINPRMSGGTYYSALFGMNIAELLLLDSINQSEKYDIDKFIDFEDKYVTHVEKAIKIEKGE